MGSGVGARCDCGFSASSLIGGGIDDYTTVCLFPCLCEQCNSFVQVNLLAGAQKCPKCQAADPIPYDDPRLAGPPGYGKVASWDMQEELGRNLVLTDGRYKCPSCNKMDLEFFDTFELFD